MTTQSPITNSPAPADDFQYRQALEAVRPEMAAIPEDKLVSINLDIPEIVKTVRGAMADIAPYKERVISIFPAFDPKHFDNLEKYAMALGYANTRHRAVSSPAEPIEKLQEEAIRARELLLSDLNALAYRGLIDGARLAQVKRVNGYNNLAQEVMLMTELARKNWSAIANRTSLTLEEIAQAEKLADRLVKAAGEKEQLKPTTTVEHDDRRRAYALLVNAYDEVRRAISFVRWKEDDVDEIAPSLYQKGRRKAEPAAVAPVAPSPASAAATAQPAPPAAAATSTGLPDEDPIIRR